MLDLGYVPVGTAAWEVAIATKAVCWSHNGC